MSKKKKPRVGIFRLMDGIPIKEIETSSEFLKLDPFFQQKILANANELRAKDPDTTLFLQNYLKYQSLESIIKKSEDRLEELDVFEPSGVPTVPFSIGDDLAEFREEFLIGGSWRLIKSPRQLDAVTKGEVMDNLNVILHARSLLDGLNKLGNEGAPDRFLKMLREIISEARMMGLHEGRAAAYDTSVVQGQKKARIKIQSEGTRNGRPPTATEAEVRAAVKKHRGNVSAMATQTGYSSARAFRARAKAIGIELSSAAIRDKTLP